MTVKLMITGRRRLGQTLAAHRHHMKTVHGGMVLDFIAKHPGHAPQRYVQNHGFDGIFADASLARDFVTELWFPDMAAVGASRETPFYQTNLLPDEPKMVDQPSVIGMITREVPVRIIPQGPIKVVVMHRAAEGLSRADFESAWAGQTPDFALPHTRCHVLTPGPVDGVDMFWLPDADAATAFAQNNLSAFLDQLEAAGLTMPKTTAVVIAQEHVLFDGPSTPPLEKGIGA